MERYDVGIVLAFVGGIMTALVQGLQFAYSVINSQSLFYALGMAVGFCVVAGSVISYRSTRLAGSLLVFFRFVAFLSRLSYIISPDSRLLNTWL